MKRSTGELGLGLAITKRLTQLLQGTVELKSEPGEGSEFIVKIPVRKVKSTTEEPASLPIPRVDLKGKKVLLVDDESSQLALSKELIKSIGLQCDTAPNGKEALTKLNQNQYHLILTDIQMPIMDGFGLVEAIRKNPKIAHIPVIAISGRTNVPAEKYNEAGFSGNILKPYKPSDLLYRISEILKIELESKQNYSRRYTTELSHYSLEEISLFAGDDQVALDTILTAFIESTRLNLKEMDLAAEEGNWDRTGNIAHRMLPMFKQLKVKEIVPKLQQLEEKQTAEFENGKMKNLLAEIEQFLLQLETEVKA
ncbi:response regulator [Antarcticibacterium sp. 1MA-6-2]|uniref:response regulator n=1 Tax=Antarcticibacterium sp. 1MA-6-2 TaxID=2908210 RepID=UPI001F2BFBEA|nr:response regulator [Antarcticibacterium sp. 1MA-6-2]UJH89931.1 response regulator [Antarcticibacterium sp. 1MA-6-2]